jgi:hypothetical protein
MLASSPKPDVAAPQPSHLDKCKEETLESKAELKAMLDRFDLHKEEIHNVHIFSLSRLLSAVSQVAAQEYSAREQLEMEFGTCLLLQVKCWWRNLCLKLVSPYPN